MQFTLPESIIAYYGSPSLEAAVNALLTKTTKMPPDLSWEELPGFYSAWAAAHRVMGDYAFSLASVWDLVWKDAIPPAWTPKSIDDQIDADRDDDPHPTQIWAWDCLTRRHDLAGQNLCTLVAMEGGNVSVGFGLFGRNGRTSLRKAFAGFERDPETELWWSIGRVKAEADGVIDLGGLHEQAKAVISAIDAADQEC